MLTEVYKQYEITASAEHHNYTRTWIPKRSSPLRLLTKSPVTYRVMWASLPPKRTLSGLHSRWARSGLMSTARSEPDGPCREAMTDLNMHAWTPASIFY